jgi:hypothetical protein
MAIETDHDAADFRYAMVHVYAQKDLGQPAIQRRARVCKLTIEENLAEVIILGGMGHLMHLPGAAIYLLNQDFASWNKWTKWNGARPSRTSTTPPPRSPICDSQLDTSS